jgi:hypothetical protein
MTSTQYQKTLQRLAFFLLGSLSFTISSQALALDKVHLLETDSARLSYYSSRASFLISSTAPFSSGNAAQSRINLAKGRTRFTPLRANGNPVSAGWEHVTQRHFGTNNQSQFTISQDQLRGILQRPEIVRSRISPIDSGVSLQYVRTVNTNTNIGVTRVSDGANPTTWVKIYTDRAGNLITTFPVPPP